jgi:hypothetical protein
MAKTHATAAYQQAEIMTISIMTERLSTKDG